MILINRKTKFLMIICLMAFLLFIVGCSSGNESADNVEDAEMTLTLGHVTPESHVWHETALLFNDELKSRSNDRIDLEIHPAGTMGDESDMYQQIQSGSLDMVILTSAELTNHSDDFSAWLMPFIFKDHQDAFDMAETEEAMNLFDSIDGVHGLGSIFAGMRHILKKDGSVKNVDDLSGDAIRVTPSPVIVDFWESLGSSPTSVPLPELYSAFQTGVIDTVDVDLDALMSASLYEVGKDFTQSNHMAWPSLVMINENSWSELTEEDQQIIEEAFEVAREFNLEANIEREKSNLEEFIENGGKVHDLEDKDEFYEVAEELHEKYSKDNERVKQFIDVAKEKSE